MEIQDVYKLLLRNNVSFVVPQDASANANKIATYYNLIMRRQVGRHVVVVCNAVSCLNMGCDRTIAYFKCQLSIDFGETTEDDRLTLLPFPCLGACDRAPVVLIDNQIHGDMTADKLLALLRQLA